MAPQGCTASVSIAFHSTMGIYPPGPPPGGKSSLLGTKAQLSLDTEGEK